MADGIAAYAIKAEIADPQAETVTFVSLKTMYGGKTIAAGDTAFLFASENEGGTGLFAMGVVTAAEALARMPGIVRQTPRVALRIRRVAVAKCPLGRADLKGWTDWKDGRPESELNFKLYRQATNKAVGLSDEAAVFLEGLFRHRQS